MRWNQFATDLNRASALGDILLGAAFAGGTPTDTKLAAVHGQVAKVLGAVSELPPEIMARLDGFDPAWFDLTSACRALALADERDCIALMKAVVVVVDSDGASDGEGREGRAFALRLATHLGLSLTAALEVVGLPQRPITGPRPRPSVRPRGNLTTQPYRGV